LAPLLRAIKGMQEALQIGRHGIEVFADPLANDQRCDGPSHHRRLDAVERDFKDGELGAHATNALAVVGLLPRQQLMELMLGD